MNKPLWLAISFWVPWDGVLEDGLESLEGTQDDFTVIRSCSLISTVSEGNPGEIFAPLGFLDGIEFPFEKNK